MTVDWLISSIFATSVANQPPGKTGCYGLAQPFCQAIDKPVSVGIVMEEVGTSIPRQMMRCNAPDASMRPFRGMRFPYHA